MQTADELATAMHEAEALMSSAIAKMGEVVRRGVEVERELGLSPTVTAGAQGHAAAALARLTQAQLSFSRAHKSAQRIAAARRIVISADGGGDKNAPDSVWRFPFMGSSASRNASQAEGEARH